MGIRYDSFYDDTAAAYESAMLCYKFMYLLVLNKCAYISYVTISRFHSRYPGGGLKLIKYIFLALDLSHSSYCHPWTCIYK